MAVPEAMWSYKPGQQNLTFFFVPQTSIDELSGTFMLNSDVYTEFFCQAGFQRYRGIVNVQSSTLRAHETGRNFPLKCRGL